MNKAIRRLAVGAALAAFTLTGCASWPGTGVRVGETRISDDAIVRASVAIQDIRGGGDADATEVLQTAASGFALGEAARQIAAQNNIEVTTAAKQSAVTVSPALFASPDVGPLIDGIATNAVVASKLGQIRPGDGAAFPPDRGQPPLRELVRVPGGAHVLGVVDVARGVAGQSLNLWPISTPN